MIRGTIDRIVDDKKVVILVENEDNTEQIVVSKEQLPESLRYEGCLIKFKKTEDGISELEHLKEEEKERKERIQDKFDRLSKKLSEDN